MSENTAIIPRRSHPIRQECLCDFERVATSVTDEPQDIRAARLKRESSRDRSAALRVFKRQGSRDFVEGLCCAVHRAIAEGASFPFHFDVTFRRGRYSSIERYTILDVYQFEHLWDGNMTWNSLIRSSKRRSRAIEPHYTHPAVVFPE